MDTYTNVSITDCHVTRLVAHCRAARWLVLYRYAGIHGVPPPPQNFSLQNGIPQQSMNVYDGMGELDQTGSLPLAPPPVFHPQPGSATSHRSTALLLGTDGQATIMLRGQSHGSLRGAAPGSVSGGALLPVPPRVRTGRPAPSSADPVLPPADGLNVVVNTQFEPKAEDMDRAAGFPFRR